jgi:hypothetical protein
MCGFPYLLHRLIASMPRNLAHRKPVVDRITPNRLSARSYPMLWHQCPDGGIGRRTSFRCWRWQRRGGSSPLPGTSFWEKENIRGIFSRKTAKRPFAIRPAGSTYPIILALARFNIPARDLCENSRSDSEAPVRKVTLSSHLNALVKVIAGGCCVNPDA